MFITASSPTYTAPVHVAMPGAKPQTFTAKFKRLEQDEINALTSRARDGELSDAKLIDEVMIGWDGVADADKTPLEFTPENLAAVLNIYPVGSSIVKAYFDSLNTAKK